MQQLQSLLEKYGAGTLSQEEKVKLLEILSIQEDQLKDWSQEAFRADVEKEAIYLTEAHSADLLQQIQAKKKQAVKRMYGRQVFRVAAAVLVLLAGVQVFRYLNAGKQDTVHAVAAVQPAKQYKQVHNTGTAINRYLLPDSSVVLLQPGTAIAYNAPFDSTRREVVLRQGKALFTVAQEAGRPFTVHAGNVATTALGTAFTVEALSQGMVNVRLYEGRVVVRSTGAIHKEVYLKPGQQVLMNAANAYCKVSLFDMADLAGGSKKRAIAVPGPLTGNGLLFRKTPLTDVFSRLNAKYGVVIVSNPADMKGLVFTGQFSESDSLPSILAVINSLNSLSLRQQEDTIFINKEK
jgi:ferric-dicitrate binding protein FerR (iron transport regulator)